METSDSPSSEVATKVAHLIGAIANKNGNGTMNWKKIEIKKL